MSIESLFPSLVCRLLPSTTPTTRRPRRPPSSQFVISLSPLSCHLDLTSQGPRLTEPNHPTTIFLICHLSFTISSALSHHLIKEDGIQILQVYSKEISKRMPDTVKSRNVVASTTQNDATESETVSSAVEPTATVASEDAKAKEY
ncbi:MFP1 attachment factor 1-like [Pyrus communis]|uniref:MFP1 attachment factor 1-like n=1 Tax=Pyrus communis TaxID=23211 RepID=UPI0035C01AE1